MQNCSVLKNYRPPFLYSGKIRQTLFQVYVSKDRTIDIKYTRHLLKMADGGTVSIDWATPAENNFTRVEEKLCVVFPGLSGGSDRGYVKNLVKTMIQNRVKNRIKSRVQDREETTG